MERQGTSRRNWRRVLWSLLIMLAGFLSSAIFIVIFYLTYEVAVGSRGYCTLWTDIPGRFVAFVICYYVAGLCGCLPIPERWRVSWLPVPFFLWWRFQSWKKFFIFCLVRPLSYMAETVLRRTMNNSETPLLRDGNTEQFYDCLPGPSGTITYDQDTSRISPGGTRRVNCKSYGYFRKIPKASASSLLQNENGEEFHDCVPAIPEPSATAAVDDPRTSEKTPSKTAPTVDYFRITTDRTQDNSQSSDESFMSFDSPIAGFIVPMMKGRSNKPPYIRDSSFSDLESSNDPSGASKGAMGGSSADNELDLSESQKGSSTTTGSQTDIPPGTPDLVVPLPLYPRIPWKWLTLSGQIPRVAARLHKRNMLAERAEVDKQTKEARKKEMEHLQTGAASPDNKSDAEWARDGEHTQYLKSRPALMHIIMPKRKVYSRGRSRTTPGNLSRRRQFIPVHRRSTSDIPHQFAEPRMRTVLECCEDSPSLQFMLNRITQTFRKLDGTKSPEAAGVSETRRNVCIEVEDPSDKNSDLSSVPGRSKVQQFMLNRITQSFRKLDGRNSPEAAGVSETRRNVCIEVEDLSEKNSDLSSVPGRSSEVQQTDKPDVEISVTELDEPSDGNSNFLGVPGSSTGMQQTEKPDVEISVTEADDPKSICDTDPVTKRN